MSFQNFGVIHRLTYVRIGGIEVGVEQLSSIKLTKEGVELRRKDLTLTKV